MLDDARRLERVSRPRGHDHRARPHSLSARGFHGAKAGSRASATLFVWQMTTGVIIVTPRRLWPGLSDREAKGERACCMAAEQKKQGDMGVGGRGRIPARGVVRSICAFGDGAAGGLDHRQGREGEQRRGRTGRGPERGGRGFVSRRGGPPTCMRKTGGYRHWASQSARQNLAGLCAHNARPSPIPSLLPSLPRSNSATARSAHQKRSFAPSISARPSGHPRLLLFYPLSTPILFLFTPTPRLSATASRECLPPPRAHAPRGNLAPTSHRPLVRPLQPPFRRPIRRPPPLVKLASSLSPPNPLALAQTIYAASAPATVALTATPMAQGMKLNMPPQGRHRSAPHTRRLSAERQSAP